MTSETIRPGSGGGGRSAEGRGHGLIFFAVILMFVDGFFNMLYGIAVRRLRVLHARGSR
jgi:hypothetical protein